MNYSQYFLLHYLDACSKIFNINQTLAFYFVWRTIPLYICPDAFSRPEYTMLDFTTPPLLRPVTFSFHFCQAGYKYHADLIHSMRRMSQYGGITMNRKKYESKRNEDQFAEFILKLYQAYKDKYGDPEQQKEPGDQNRAGKH